MNQSDENFLKGNVQFTRDSNVGKIINKGNISAKDRGYVALLAPEIINEGVIIKQGSIDDLKNVFDRKKIIVQLLNNHKKILKVLENRYHVKYENGLIEILSKTPEIDIIEISKILCDKGCSFSSISTIDYNLEDIFLFYIKEEGTRVGNN